jgi:predicted RNA-binding Zn-ribbon protein involved in translation (DUF1610 family)
MRDAETVVTCPECHAPYHAECWEENGGCAIYGCKLVPKVDMRGGMEIPASFWGREHKPCPACGTEILAAAVRCRHCGATFSSAQPEDAGTFRKRAEQNQVAPALRRQAVWLFVFCVLPFTAPVAAVIALVWWRSHRDEIKTLPGIHVGLARLALIVGLGQTAIAIIMGVLFAVFRGA